MVIRPNGYAIWKIIQVPGGNKRDSFLVNGVAFKKTFSYAGFEQQPMKFLNPKILLLNIELELKSEKENAKIRLSDPSQYQSIVDAEWNIIYDKLDTCVQSGAKVVLSRLAIGDLATQYFGRSGYLLCWACGRRGSAACCCCHWWNYTDFSQQCH